MGQDSLRLEACFFDWGRAGGHKGLSYSTSSLLGVATSLWKAWRVSFNMMMTHSHSCKTCSNEMYNKVAAEFCKRHHQYTIMMRSYVEGAHACAMLESASAQTWSNTQLLSTVIETNLPWTGSTRHKVPRKGCGKVDTVGCILWRNMLKKRAPQKMGRPVLHLLHLPFEIFRLLVHKLAAWK